MYRTLLGTALLAGSLALAQQPSTPHDQTTPGQTAGQSSGQNSGQSSGQNTGRSSKQGSSTSTDQNAERSTAKTAGENNRSMNQTSDHKFVMDAAVGGMAEVQLGKLASEKATNPDVKQFAQKMVEDHGKANDELKAAASKESIDLPTSLDSKHQATMDRLSKMSGADFDKAYVKEMVKDHDMDVKEFQKEAQNGQNSSVRDFASKTLPTLQEHQKMIHDIDKNKMSSKGMSADRSKSRLSFLRESPRAVQCRALTQALFS
jgi:putative membrane protein